MTCASTSHRYVWCYQVLYACISYHIISLLRITLLEHGFLTNIQTKVTSLSLKVLASLKFVSLEMIWSTGPTNAMDNIAMTRPGERYHGGALLHIYYL